MTGHVYVALIKSEQNLDKEVFNQRFAVFGDKDMIIAKLNIMLGYLHKNDMGSEQAFVIKRILDYEVKDSTINLKVLHEVDITFKKQDNSAEKMTQVLKSLNQGLMQSYHEMIDEKTSFTYKV